MNEDNFYSIFSGVNKNKIEDLKTKILIVSHNCA